MCNDITMAGGIQERYRIDCDKHVEHTEINIIFQHGC